MIRKRDFLIFIIVLAFLLGAIVLTVWTGVGRTASTNFAEMILSDKDIILTVEIDKPADDKESRLDALRAKLALRPEVIEAPAEIAVSEESTSTEPSDIASTTIASDLTNIKNCPTYQVSIPLFLNGMLHSEVSGTQRLFSSGGAVLSATSTTEKNTILSLPVRTSTAGFTSCIPMSVVAVTPAGLPINNTDFAKYKGSGESSLIGYTLDGFELYGLTSTIDTDECGGASIGGVYRYYLSAERKAVLNCFVSIPVAI